MGNLFHLGIVLEYLNRFFLQDNCIRLYWFLSDVTVGAVMYW